MNKKIGVIALIIVVLLTIFGVYRYLTKEDANTTLNAIERSWIDSNKNKVIDLAIPSDLAILSSGGSGVIFDFLDDLEETTGLDFNELSYSDEKEISSSYKIVQKKKKETNDILVYSDNYALIAKKSVNYNSTDDIKNIVIGVLDGDLDSINKYLKGSNATYKSYNNTDDMFNDVKDSNIDAIALPKLKYLNTVMQSDNLHIAYNISEYNVNYVIELGKEKNLNNILAKYYKKWSLENFETDFNKYLTEDYFKAKKIDEKAQVKFRSKRYSYGFVVNSPFDAVTKEGIKGFNHSFLSKFSLATNIEIDYKKYSSISNMMNDFNSNNLDIVFSSNNLTSYKTDTYTFSSIYDESVVIIADENNNSTINSVNSLSDETVYTVKDSLIDGYLKENGIKTKTFDNVKTLINNLNKKSIAAIDYYTYDFYIRTNLKEFRNAYMFNLDSDYSYISRDISANKIFNELFDFYISFVSSNKIINDSYSELLNINNSDRLLQTLLTVFMAALFILVGILFGKLFKGNKKPNKKLSKSDKLRYIDELTSLKNRNYLNDNLQKWDNSDIYPQGVVVVDLNNIAYINDNFGHTEGDKIIVEGAGILISNQLDNSEIIRTNGNEFLIFVIGKDEKAIISYIRKLNKEFKNLTHGFGAAIGYSMIVDDVKTVDDAINEATTNMRTNKENK